jgi:hypothetical protein
MAVEDTRDVIMHWVGPTGEVLDGNPLRPPKALVLECLSAGRPPKSLQVWQLHESLVRRLLTHIGQPREQKVAAFSAVPFGRETFHGDRPWSLPARRSWRSRTYVFRDDADPYNESGPIYSARVARARLKLGAGLGATVPAGPVLIGAHGSGSGEAELAFAVDPTVRPRVVSGSQLRRALHDAFTDELPELETELSGALEELYETDLDVPDGWEFELSEDVIEAGDGERRLTQLDVRSTTPGRTLAALEVTDIARSERLALSDVFAVEVDDSLDVFIYSDFESDDGLPVLPQGNGPKVSPSPAILGEQTSVAGTGQVTVSSI